MTLQGGDVQTVRWGRGFG